MCVATIALFGSIFYAVQIVTLRKYFVSRLYFAKNKYIFSVQPSLKLGKIVYDFLFLRYLRQFKKYNLWKNYILYIINIGLGLWTLIVHVLAAILDYIWMWKLSKISLFCVLILYALSTIYIIRHPIIIHKRNIKKQSVKH